MHCIAANTVELAEVRDAAEEAVWASGTASDWSPVPCGQGGHQSKDHRRVSLARVKQTLKHLRHLTA